jgi:hypothetical protein
MQHHNGKELNMAAKAKPAPEPAPQSTYNSVAGLIGEWIRQGTEGFIATQKILLDLAAQQNALALTMLRERLGFSAPNAKSLTDFAAIGMKNFKNFMEAEQVILDVVARQNTIVADGLEPAVSGTPVEGLAEVVRQGLDNFITAEKQFLDILEAQADGATADFEEGKRFDTGRLSEIAREGMRNFLHSQKKFLDIVEEQLVAKKDPTPEPAHNGATRVDIFEMAKKSVNAFIEAQQRLLDLASDQIEMDVKFTREMLNVERGPATTLAETVRKSIDSFVAAQKALGELASKPRKAAEGAEESAPELVVVASDAKASAASKSRPRAAVPHRR